jgi:hypothetical protein
LQDNFIPALQAADSGGFDGVRIDDYFFLPTDCLDRCRIYGDSGAGSQRPDLQ